MRMMLTARLPVEAANAAMKDWSMAAIMKQTIDRLQPEAVYFTLQHGKRTLVAFFDMKDTSEVYVITEPLFVGLNAEIEFAPAMSPADLAAGVQALNS